ncbi:PKD domain-containing protein [Xylophilus sp.]|uniref:PKD domain-containing protein n=1 Tax=Xylophilus sp. TaxID=2653893 RepID=UPI0013BE5B08|nr:PKD domain-containing protein [Xylophilus sp.]KAF1047390.1 MAG: hypothetical protein GAK38_01909 [Xylophilus sp.]
MKPSLRNLMAGLASATALLLAACGGGGGGGGESTATPPTAVASASPTSGPAGTTVTLDGSGSSTPNGGTLSYEWSLASRPDGSAAALSNAADAKPTFVIDQPGEYVAALVVKDAVASSTAARVTVTGTTLVPVAVVTPQTQGVLVGATVTLDGSQSVPPTGVDASALSYQWKLTEQPTGGTVALSGATSAKATFLAEKVGIYRATLVVSHGDQTSAAAEATVTVSTANSSPVISLNVPATAVRGETIVLDGSGSSDPDGDQLHYRWSIPTYIANIGNPKPQASNATIGSATSAKATFVPDAAGTYYFDVTVYDGSVAATQRVTVKVTKPEGATNIEPVAQVGAVTFAEVNATECEIGAYCGVSASRSYDADGDTLTYKWTWWNTATPDIKNTATGSSLILSALDPRTTAATYGIQLVANDGTVDSTTANYTVIVKTGANKALSAKVTVDSAKVLKGDTITFDGSGSTDANGDKLEYLWTLTDRPDGSTAVLQNAGTASSKASIVADQSGIYTVQLQLRDSAGAVSTVATATSSASVFAKEKNNPPVVAKLSLYGSARLDSEPAADQPRILLSDSALAAYLTMFDPDQDTPLYYLATPTRQPAGSALSAVSGSYGVDGSGGTTNTSSLGSVKVAGEYEVEVILSDGVASSAAKRASISFVEQANFPSLLIESGIGIGAAAPTTYSQGFFPFATKGLLTVLSSSGNLYSSFNVWYRLTAFDQDYTITGLQATSAVSGYAPSFSGLANGQVIRKGEKVTFSLQRPSIPDEAVLAAQLSAILASSGASSDAYTTELTRQAALLAAYQFTWSFRVAERDGYTFYFGPN